MKPNRLNNFDENNKVEDLTRGQIGNAWFSRHQFENNQIYNESMNTQANSTVEAINISPYQGSDISIGESQPQWWNSRSSRNSQTLQRSETVQNLLSSTTYPLPVSGTNIINDQTAQASNSQYSTHSTGYYYENPVFNNYQSEESKYKQAFIPYFDNYPSIPITTITTTLGETNQHIINTTISAIAENPAESVFSYESGVQSLTANQNPPRQALSSYQFIANASDISCGQSERPTNVPLTQVKNYSNESTPTPSFYKGMQQHSTPRTAVGPFQLLSGINQANNQQTARVSNSSNSYNWDILTENLNRTSYTPETSQNFDNLPWYEVGNNQMDQTSQFLATSVVRGNPQPAVQGSGDQSNSYNERNSTENFSHISYGQSRISKYMPPAEYLNETTPSPLPYASAQQHSTPSTAVGHFQSLSGNNQMSRATFHAISSTIQDKKQQVCQVTNCIDSYSRDIFTENVNRISYTPETSQNLENPLLNENRQNLPTFQTTISTNNNRLFSGCRRLVPSFNNSPTQMQPMTLRSASGIESQSNDCNNLADKTTYSNTTPYLTHLLQNPPKLQLHKISNHQNSIYMEENIVKNASLSDQVNNTSNYCPVYPNESCSVSHVNRVQQLTSTSAGKSALQSGKNQARYPQVLSAIISKATVLRKCPSLEDLSSVKKVKPSADTGESSSHNIRSAVQDKVERVSGEVLKAMCTDRNIPTLVIVCDENNRDIEKSKVSQLVLDIFLDYKMNKLEKYKKYIASVFVTKSPVCYNMSESINIGRKVYVDIDLFTREVTILMVMLKDYIRVFMTQYRDVNKMIESILEIYNNMKKFKFEISRDSLTQENVEAINRLVKHLQENDKVQKIKSSRECENKDFKPATATQNEKLQLWLPDNPNVQANNQTVEVQGNRASQEYQQKINLNSKDYHSMLRNPSSKSASLNLPIGNTLTEHNNQTTARDLHHLPNLDRNYMLDKARNSNSVKSCVNKNFVENVDFRVIENKNLNENIIPTPSFAVESTNSQVQNDKSFIASQRDTRNISGSVLDITNCTNSRNISNISQLNQPIYIDDSDSALEVTNEMSSRDISEDF